MTDAPAYNPQRPRAPVPLKRQAETLAFAHSRWWDFYGYLARVSDKDAEKHFDLDIALADAGAMLADLATLSRLSGGDDKVRAWIKAAIAQAKARGDAA